jgi:hypothetical protein
MRTEENRSKDYQDFGGKNWSRRGPRVYLALGLEIWYGMPASKCYLWIPLQNPTQGVFVAERSNVLGRQTGLWSTEAKVWGIVPKAAWHWGGDSSVANGLFEAPGSITSFSTGTGLCWWWLFNSPVLVGLIWTTRNVQEKKKQEMTKPSKRVL